MAFWNAAAPVMGLGAWLSVLGPSAAASAQLNSAPPSSGARETPEASILSEMHSVDLTDEREGQLAEGRAVSGRTKAYARMLAREHMAIDELIRGEAGRLDIPLVDVISPAQQAEIDDLGVTENFDLSFARDQAAGHTKLSADLKAAGKAVSDEGVRRLIENLLMRCRRHERAAQQLWRRSTKTS